MTLDEKGRREKWLSVSGTRLPIIMKHENKCSSYTYWTKVKPLLQMRNMQELPFNHISSNIILVFNTKIPPQSHLAQITMRVYLLVAVDSKGVDISPNKWELVYLNWIYWFHPSQMENVFSHSSTDECAPYVTIKKLKRKKKICSICYQYELVTIAKKLKRWVRFEVNRNLQGVAKK